MWAVIGTLKNAPDPPTKKQQTTTAQNPLDGSTPLVAETTSCRPMASDTMSTRLRMPPHMSMFSHDGALPLPAFFYWATRRIFSMLLPLANSSISLSSQRIFCMSPSWISSTR